MWYPLSRQLTGSDLLISGPSLPIETENRNPGKYQNHRIPVFVQAGGRFFFREFFLGFSKEKHHTEPLYILQ
jgi:hypothetical protein